MTPEQLENESALKLAEYLYNHPRLAHKLKIVVNEVLKRIAAEEVEARRRAALAVPYVSVPLSDDLKGLEVKELPFSEFRDFLPTEPMPLMEIPK